MIVDTSNKGYKYYSSNSRTSHAGLEWIGVVAIKDDVGALAFNPRTGFYVMLRHGGKAIELDPIEVMEGLNNPQTITPKGPKPSPIGRTKPHTLTLPDGVVNAARILGHGNLSKGMRLAVEYATTREQEFMQWVADKR